MTEDGPVVLIVEDEPLVLDVAADEFAEAGYQVLTAKDDRTALSLLEGPHDIDLLFTDIRIPGDLDGWGIASAARHLRPRLSVIYATGFSAEAPQMVEGARFFKKPYRVSEIINVAEHLLRSA